VLRFILPMVIQNNAVYTRRCLALVFRHSLERRETCSSRAGEQKVLQGFTLFHRPPFVCRTIRTWSRRTVAVDDLPVNWHTILPLRVRRRHQQFALSSFALPPERICQAIRVEAPNGSGSLRDSVMLFGEKLKRYSLNSERTFAFPGMRSNRVDPSCDVVSTLRGRLGFTLFPFGEMTRWVRSALAPAVLVTHDGGGKQNPPY